MKNDLNKSISQNVKKYRLLNNMTQDQLAEKLSLDTQYYSQLERGERNFTIEKIAALCAIFHIGIEKIIDLGQTDSDHTDELLLKIQSHLKPLTYHQLILVDKFISEIIPYTESYRC